MLFDFVVPTKKVSSFMKTEIFCSHNCNKPLGIQRYTLGRLGFCISGLWYSATGHGGCLNTGVKLSIV